jgi:hypothetical protein
MNDQSSVCLPESLMVTKARVALLVDGENVSSAVAGRLIMASLKHGELMIRRVYGNAAKMPGWEAAAGFRVIHAGVGKNATDMLLCVDAMMLILDRQAEVLVIASSDGDFRHLASAIRERGVPVFGIGEEKSPDHFRKACTNFVEIQVKPPVIQPVKPPSPVLSDLDKELVAEVQSKGSDGISLALLGSRMHIIHKNRGSVTPAPHLRTYLDARPHLFLCDPKGPNAKVRVKP